MPRICRRSHSEATRPVSLQGACFLGLRKLAVLELEDCGLATIPAALTALGDSLTRVALPSNDGPAAGSCRRLDPAYAAQAAHAGSAEARST